MPGRGRSLDFIVIGAQKAGTTTLWHHLRRHPLISTPEMKEEPFFCMTKAERPQTLDEYMDKHFGDAPEEALLGKATPQYMMGFGEFDVERTAQRISAALPDVRLIALLRDPIERAFSHYRMSVRRKWEERTLDTALDEELEPARLSEARSRPTETNSYLAQGEYGRILAIYRELFPPDQIHVELTADLDRDPGGVLDRILTFLSLPSGFRPPRLGAHHHRGGTRKLLDAESRAALLEFMEENVWPNLGEERQRVKRRFTAFLMLWNIAPEHEPAPISAEVRTRLEAHYEADAEILTEVGVPAAPWVEAWNASSQRRTTT